MHGLSKGVEAISEGRKAEGHPPTVVLAVGVTSLSLKGDLERLVTCRCLLQKYLFARTETVVFVLF